MANTNTNLHKAKATKNDEFYTQLKDIEKELTHYKSHFKGKAVYCNCDNPRESAFWEYFHINFKEFGLRRLIATYYSYEGTSFKMEYSGGNDLDTSSGMIIALKGDGDFRSPECIEILKATDMVVTNPPFSLFREHINLLMKYSKEFVIVGNINAIKYKEVFPFIKDNLVWLGVNTGEMAFKVPADSEPRETRFWIDDEGQKWRSLGNACWFTNIDIEKCHLPIELTASYNEEAYPKYDTYDAIEVSRTANIPADYAGIMGVPITMLQHYCPEQFEIVGEFNHGCDNEYDLAVPFIGGKKLYPRIAIKHRNQKKPLD